MEFEFAKNYGISINSILLAVVLSVTYSIICTY